MSWLRLEDGFAEHPKVLELVRAGTAWAWLEVLLYCARRRSPRVTVALLERHGLDAGELERLGLLDRLEGELLEVHDWADYNGARSGAERTAAWRDRKYGEARYSHGGRRGRYAGAVDNFGEDGSTASSVTGITSHERHAKVTTRALGPHPQGSRVLTSSQDVAKAGEGLNPGIELLAARLLEAAGELDESGRDFIRGAALRLPEAVSARVLEGVAGGRARDRAAYIIGALRRELELLEGAA